MATFGAERAQRVLGPVRCGSLAVKELGTAASHRKSKKSACRKRMEGTTSHAHGDVVYANG